MTMTTKAKSKKIAKRDHTNLPAKLDMRRYFLKKYHGHHVPIVFDACRGEGQLWNKLRQEFKVNYWGVDKKKIEGQSNIVINSIRIVSMPTFHADMVDIDTYGAPWAHWLALLDKIKADTTIFLTEGRAMATCATSGDVLRATGCVFNELKLPVLLPGKMANQLSTMVLAKLYDHGLTCVECQEIVANVRVRYFGLHIRKAK